MTVCMCPSATLTRGHEPGCALYRPHHCGLCGRLLNNPSDPLSADCGGDCWGCVGEIEALGGDAGSVAKVRAEIEAGLRPTLRWDEADQVVLNRAD